MDGEFEYKLFNMKINFTENDIRPREYQPGLKRAREEDIVYLNSKKDDFVRVLCPACKSGNSHFVFEKYGFDFVSCTECNTVYMNPRAPQHILSSFYASSKMYDYWNTYIFPSSEKVRRDNIIRPRVARIISICERFNVPTQCLMEVGAGFGTFCQEVMDTKKFKKVIAVEPSSSLAESCRARGIEVIESAIEDVREADVRPNVIVSFEVIEHLFDPEFFLESCHRLLAPNSIIAVTCPNLKGFDMATLGLASDSIDAEHINLFNPKALRILFERSGFTVLECFTPGEIDVDIVRNKILTNEYDVSNQPFLRTLLLEREKELGQKFQVFLQENNLSSHMWIVARI